MLTHFHKNETTISIEKKCSYMEPQYFDKKKKSKQIPKSRFWKLLYILEILDPTVATLWCSFRSKTDEAWVDQAMLVLTVFPAVVVSIKLEFYVIWREVGQTQGCVGTERNVTYFSVNKLLLVRLVCDNDV